MWMISEWCRNRSRIAVALAETAVPGLVRARADMNRVFCVSGVLNGARECNVAIIGVGELRRTGGRGGMGMALRHPALANGTPAAWGIAPCQAASGRHLMAPLRLPVGSPTSSLEFTSGEHGIDWSAAPASVAEKDVAVAKQEGLQVAAAMTWLRN